MAISIETLHCHMQLAHIDLSSKKYEKHSVTA